MLIMSSLSCYWLFQVFLKFFVTTEVIISKCVLRTALINEKLLKQINRRIIASRLVRLTYTAVKSFN